MQYYLSATVTGKLVLSDKDSFDPHYIAATIIAESAKEVAEKLRQQGFKVRVDISHGLE